MRTGTGPALVLENGRDVDAFTDYLNAYPRDASES